MSQNTLTVKDVHAQDFIAAYAAHLKRSGKVTLPRNCDILKTAIQKELSPLDEDWYYSKMATLARRVYLHKNCGVKKFANSFGCAGRHHLMRQHHMPACRGIIRHALQELEKLRIVAKSPDGGRIITKEGQKQLDQIANQIKA